MSANTIESAEAKFLLTYCHNKEHEILNDPDDPKKRSCFAWDCQGPTGRLKGVRKCGSADTVDVDMTKDEATCTWIGNYKDDDQAWTLTISDFVYCPSKKTIAGDIKRCHSPEGGIGGDDMGSFTGTKTWRLTAPAAR
jgi:hypothetical protein